MTKENNKGLGQKILFLAALLSALYGGATFGSWWLATQQEWCNPNHGILKLNFVDNARLSGFVESPTTPKVRTNLENGFPILFNLQNVKFKVPSHGSKGDARLIYRFNSIKIILNYDPPLKSPSVIVFKKCR